MLVHHHEITYALALPAGTERQGREPWLRRMHRIIAAALANWQIAAVPHDLPDQHPTTPLCSGTSRAATCAAQGNKIVGSVNASSAARCCSMVGFCWHAAQ